MELGERLHGTEIYTLQFLISINLGFRVHDAYSILGFHYSTNVKLLLRYIPGGLTLQTSK